MANSPVVTTVIFKEFPGEHSEHGLPTAFLPPALQKEAAAVQTGRGLGHGVKDLLGP